MNLFEKSPALFSGKYTEYGTPECLYHELNSKFHFTLDAATTEDNPLGTPKFYTKKDNGLTKSWAGESVFLNPPYGRDISLWVRKAFDSIYVDRLKAKLVVLLLPCRMDTEWMHRYILHTKNSEIEFVRGRLKFKSIHNIKDNTAPFPSLICIFKGTQI
jgi:phage N-6-adenine-methyltransferase